MEAWWNKFINSEIKRDQLWLPIVMRECDENLKDFLLLGNDVYNNPLIEIMYHS